MADETVIDVETIKSGPPPAEAESIGTAVAVASPQPENPPNPQPRNKGGRPAGKKTRWDAPSMVAKRQREAAEAAARGESRPDTDIFGDGSESGGPDSYTQEESNGDAPKSDFFTKNSQEESEQQAKANAEMQRPLAEMIWDSIIMMLCLFVGTFWQPRKIGQNLQGGEIPYDERKMVIDAFCEYLASLGMLVLTPFQKLWLAIGAYSMPRLFATIQVLKEKFFKKKQAPKPPTVVPGDTRFPNNPPAPAKAGKPENKTEPATSPGGVTLDDLQKIQ